MTEAADAVREVSVTPTLRLRLEHDGVPVFGPGPYELLVRVKNEGSLHRAAQSMHMAYSKAWRIVRDAEKHLGLEILDRRAGGVAGGGSVLTADGEDLVHRFGALQHDLRDELGRLYDVHFGGPWPSATTSVEGLTTGEGRAPALPPERRPARGTGA
jgi:molybdate transport system regulatory protein